MLSSLRLSSVPLTQYREAARSCRQSVQCGVYSLLRAFVRSDNKRRDADDAGHGNSATSPHPARRAPVPSGANGAYYWTVWL